MIEEADKLLGAELRYIELRASTTLPVYSQDTPLIVGAN